MTSTDTRSIVSPKHSPVRSDNRTRPALWARSLTWVLLVAAVIYFVVPVLWLFIASTKTAGDLYTTPGFSFAEFALWDNLEALFGYRSGIFWRWMLNSGIYSVLGSLLVTLICAMCGYAIAIYRFRGRRVLMSALLASLLIPATVTAQPVYLLLVQLGLNNTMIGVLLPSLVYPFGVMLSYIATLSAVPTEIIEAARIDGAGEFRTFFTIAVPLLRTGLTTVLLFSFIASWNSFLLPLLVLDDSTLYPVTVGLVDWSRQSSSVAQLGTLTIVGSFVSVLPLIAVFVALQRYWRSGLAAGGVKF